MQNLMHNVEKNIPEGDRDRVSVQVRGFLPAPYLRIY